MSSYDTSLIRGYLLIIYSSNQISSWRRNGVKKGSECESNYVATATECLFTMLFTQWPTLNYEVYNVEVSVWEVTSPTPPPIPTWVTSVQAALTMGHFRIFLVPLSQNESSCKFFVLKGLIFARRRVLTEARGNSEIKKNRPPFNDVVTSDYQVSSLKITSEGPSK